MHPEACANAFSALFYVVVGLSNLLDVVNLSQVEMGMFYTKLPKVLASSL